MKGRTALSIALLGILLYLEHVSGEGDGCEVQQYPTGDLRIRIFSARNATGKWVTRFYAYRNDVELDEDQRISLDISQVVTQCRGKRTLVIRGEIPDKDIFKEDTGEIRFHPKCGSNAAITNEGRTVEKLNDKEVGFALAFTNRPLKHNELFEVTLENKTKVFPHSLAIGVTPYSPDNINIPQYITLLKQPSWSMYYNYLYDGPNVVNSNYGRSLDTLVVGDRVGLMRRDYGGLHYFINGIDQGPAVAVVPHSVYGVVELYASATAATIACRS